MPGVAVQGVRRAAAALPVCGGEEFVGQLGQMGDVHTFILPAEAPTGRGFVAGLPHCEGSAAVVDAALDAGVARVLQESVAMLYRDRGDRWIDEQWPVDHYPIAVGNHAAEAAGELDASRRRGH